MQKVILTIAFLYWTLSYLHGQKDPTQRIYMTVPIDDVTRMDITEVTIAQWVYFIINNNFNPDHFPDTSSISYSARTFFDDLKEGPNFQYIEVVNNKGLLKDNYGINGFRLTKKFKDIEDADTNYFSISIPIVGISFEQAKAFCKWRESTVNKSRDVKIRVTLPSIEIYKKVNPNKDSLCKAELNCDSCSNYQFNYLHSKCTLSAKHKDNVTQGQGLLRADSYWPTILGLYNIQGNASEMTFTEGVAVGGSFRHFASESNSDKAQTYKKPEDWLGFRCLITIQ